MEYRIEKLESELTAIKLDLGILKATVATKADLAEAITGTRTSIADAKSTIIMWTVGAIFLAQVLPGLLSKLGLQ